MRKKSELQFDMEDWTGEKAFASYSSFSIDSENSGYQLYLGSFTGGIAGEGPWVDFILGFSVKAKGWI